MLSWKKRGKYCSWKYPMKFIVFGLKFWWMVFFCRNKFLFFCCWILSLFRDFDLTVRLRKKNYQPFQGLYKTSPETKEKELLSNFFLVLKIKSKILLNKWFSKCYFCHANKIWKKKEKWKIVEKSLNNICLWFTVATRFTNSFGSKCEFVKNWMLHDFFRFKICMHGNWMDFLCGRTSFFSFSFNVVVGRVGKMVSVMSQVIFWLHKKNFFFEFSIEKISPIKIWICIHCILSQSICINFFSFSFSKCHWCVNEIPTESTLVKKKAAIT